MQLPNKMIIGGIEWSVVFKELMFGSDGSNLYGCEDESTKTIYLSEYGYNHENYEIAKVKYQERIYQKILFHELWHVLCRALYLNDINTEEYACLFSVVCAIDTKVPLTKGSGERLKEILLNGIDEIENYALKKIDEYRNQLKYIIKRIEILSWQDTE